MKMYVISDNVDTLIGMRLVGVDGVVAHNHDEVQEALSQAMQDKDLAILLIVERLAKEFSALVRDIKLNNQTPLVVEIPDRHGTGRTPDFITAYIREAIGVKL